MKLKILATTTTALLGSALLGYGQAPNQKPGGTGSVGGTGAGVVEQGRGNPDGTPGRAANEAPDIELEREMNWDGAEEARVQLAELPENTRTAITNAASGAEIDGNVVRLNRDDRQVYRATATREGQEDMLVYVREDGTLLRTEQRVDYATAPENVRASIGEQWGAEVEPDEFRQVTIDGRTYYTATTGRQGDGPTQLRIDADGNVMPEAGARGTTRANSGTGGGIGAGGGVEADR